MKINPVVSFVILLPCLLLVGCTDSFKSSHEEQKISYDSDPTENPMNAELTCPKQAGGHNQSLENVDKVTGAIHYGANMYYFAKTEYSFANSLASFLIGHTNLEVTAIAPNVIRKSGAGRRSPEYQYSSTTDYGLAVGYFVTFREK